MGRQLQERKYPMARQYPRGYYVVENGEVEIVTVHDPVQETAIILDHPEATGTMREEIPDFSWAKIEEQE